MNNKITLLFAGVAASWSILSSAHAATNTYTVQPGDYLWKIAVANNTTIEQIMNVNGLTSTTIMPGQVLKLKEDPNSYTVQSSDTMWKIAVRFGVSLDELIQANPQIADPNNIWPGLSLTIPQKPTAAFLAASFPLRQGTYEPFTDNFAEARTWSATGTQDVRSHEGIDIFAKKGTPVYSAADGTIVNIGWSSLGGWRISIKVNDNTQFYYAHFSGYADGLKKGATVKQGQLLGYVGSTGYGPEGTEGKFEPHLHFGIYQINPWKAIDPYTDLKWWEANSK